MGNALPVINCPVLIGSHELGRGVKHMLRLKLQSWSTIKHLGSPHPHQEPENALQVVVVPLSRNGIDYTSFVVSSNSSHAILAHQLKRPGIRAEGVGVHTADDIVVRHVLVAQILDESVLRHVLCSDEPRFFEENLPSHHNRLALR